ncbi:MAG: exodeoxyribonuclease III [Kiritimatiellae bacterium]|nr:exodeoxyribonuclease III [Kiritimatiellia bacterium]
MKIATFNVNSIRARLPVVINWLNDNKPDIFCMQETKVQDHEFPVQAFIEAGYRIVFRGEKSYNGVAVASRAKPAEFHFGFDDGLPADASRLLAAKIGAFYVVNTYVPQGREIENAMYQYKLEWFKRLRNFFGKKFTPRDKIVWVGDLNIAPEAIDIYNAPLQENHVCYHKAVREAFAETKAWGFLDVFRKHHPEPGQYSYYDYRTPNAVARKMGWRVDHILATAPLAARSRNCYIDLKPRLEPRCSDHTIMAAEFA